MIIDPIGDLLTRIRNAYLSRIAEITIPYSNIKSDISKILKKNKYIVEYKVIDEENNKKSIILTLNDVRTTKYIPTLRRISRP
jgi:small subunit ribosomal protein S8